MLEQIIALLVSLVVAAAGVSGLQTASTAPHGVGSPEIAAAKVALARQEAAEHLAAAMQRAQANLNTEGDEENEEEQIEAAGRDTAAAAITRAMERAPEAAQTGLQNALTRVTTAPANDSEAYAGQPADVPPVTVPAGPPENVPAGPPDGVPAGPPAGVPGERP